MSAIWEMPKQLPDELVGQTTEVVHGREYPVDYDGLRATIAALRAAKMRVAERLSIGGERVTKRVLDAIAENPGVRAGLDAALRCCHDPSAGMFLVGPVGVGKTHLLAGVVSHHCLFGVPAIFTTVDEILRHVKDTFDAEGDSREPWVREAFASVPWLGVDDLGRERLTEWGAATWWAIVNDRYERNLPIGITSNARNAEDLGKVYAGKSMDATMAAGLVDRLVEMAGKPIAVTGSSHRSKVVDIGARRQLAEL